MAKQKVRMRERDPMNRNGREITSDGISIFINDDRVDVVVHNGRIEMRSCMGGELVVRPTGCNAITVEVENRSRTPQQK